MMQIMYDNATDNNYFVNIADLGGTSQALKSINYSPIKFTDKLVSDARRSYVSGYRVRYTGLLYG